MLSFLKRWSRGKNDTFKARVDEFWQWYAKNAPRLLDAIESRRLPDLQSEVTAAVNKLHPDFAWVFGPGPNGQGHSFTLSGEGNPHKQLLAAFWRAQAPTLAGWTFHAARQAAESIGNWKIQLGEVEFDAQEFWLAPRVDEEEENIAITVWHPLHSKVEERVELMALLLFLDEVLGEIGSQNWIGHIELGDHRLADSIPLAELPAFVAKVASETGWKRGGPGEMFSLYERKNPERGSLRQDIFIGVNRQMALIAECEDGMLDPDPLEGFGADYMFMAFDIRILPEKNEATRRGEIEDALTAALDREKQGCVLGGAMGQQYGYIDLLLWDGAASIETVKRVAREQGLPTGTTLEYFAKARRRDRIRL
jgi:hypothetical protein